MAFCFGPGIQFRRLGATGRSTEKGEHDKYPRKWLDLRCSAGSSALTLDIFLSDTGKGPFLLVLLIHGGAFMEGNKRDGPLSPVLHALGRGYAVVAMNYRLSGEARFPAAIQGVKATLRWVRAHAAAYSLDVSRIATWGDSVGAHLAVLAAVSAGIPALSDQSLGKPWQPDTVQVTVGWFRPYGFTTMDARFKASRIGPPMHGGPGSAESRFLAATVEHAAAVRILVPEKVTLRLLDEAGHGGAEFESAENSGFLLDWRPKSSWIVRMSYPCSAR